MEKTNEMYQVNVSERVNGETIAWVSRFSEDGYQGKLTDTVYHDGGADTTDWCVYTGSEEECENHALEINNAGYY